MAATIVGGLRQRLIRDSIYFTIYDALEQLGWFTTVVARKPITFEPEPLDNSVAVPLNTLNLFDEDIRESDLELGSNGVETRQTFYVDFYAEDNSVGRDMINDVRDIVAGRMPAIGRDSSTIDVVDWRLSEPVKLFYVDIEDVMVDRATDFPRPWLKHWFTCRFAVLDAYVPMLDPPYPSWPTLPSWEHMARELATWEPTGAATASRESLGATLVAGGDKWHGAVAAPNGKFYTVPRNQDDVLVVDPSNGTGTLNSYGVDMSGTGNWSGGALGTNGKIYCAPMVDTEILIIDVDADTATASTMGAVHSGSDKWHGAVTAPNGKIYCIPRNATEVLVIDPTSGVATLTAMGADLSGGDKWWYGCLGADGKIYGIPRNSPDVLVIDPSTDTATRTDFGLDMSSTNKWIGGANGPDGRIYCMPYSATEILIIDPVAGTASTSNMGADLSGSSKWYSGVLGRDGKIYGMPYHAADVLVVDVNGGTATRTDFGLDLSDSGKWVGGTLGVDGKVYGVPYKSPDLLVIDTQSPAVSADVTVSPFLNKI